ncbi:MAG TPA: hypothetical protein VH740_01090 [Vicinamibacterales bacterium]|jgi:polysaccharide chain length determinant protein (PEP-CTERM system associated)
MLPKQKFTPADILRIARRRLPLLVVPPVVGLLLALMVSSRMPNVYQADTLIQIVPQRVPTNFVPSTVTIKTEDRLEALGQQVKSRTQLERIITDLNLYPSMRAAMPMQDVVEVMRGNVVLDLVRPARNQPADGFYLRFKYGDPVTAARALERLSSLYIDQNARERGTLAEAAKEFLESQLEDAKHRLEAQEKRLEAFREQHAGKLPTQLQYNMQAIQSTQLQRQALVESLARDRDLKLMRERLYNDAVAAPAAIPAGAAAAAAANVDAANVTAMPPQQRLALAKANLQRLEARLTDNHPDVRRAREQVAELETQVASSASTAAQTPSGVTQEELQRRERISAMRAEIESLDRQIAFKESEEKRLSGVIADYQLRIEAVPGVESEWLALSRDYDTLQHSYQELVQKSESAKASVDLEHRQVGEQFQVLDAPRAASRPISPARPIISAGGFAGGLLLGLLVIALLELRDGSFNTKADIERVLELPVIALVPNVITVNDTLRVRRLRRLVSAAVVLSIGVGGYVVWAMQLWKFVA